MTGKRWNYQNCHSVDRSATSAFRVSMRSRRQRKLLGLHSSYWDVDVNSADLKSEVNQRRYVRVIMRYRKPLVCKDNGMEEETAASEIRFLNPNCGCKKAHASLLQTLWIWRSRLRWSSGRQVQNIVQNSTVSNLHYRWVSHANRETWRCPAVRSLPFEHRRRLIKVRFSGSDVSRSDVSRK